MILTTISIALTIFIAFSFGLLVDVIIEKFDQNTIGQGLPGTIIIILGLFFCSFLLMIIQMFIPISKFVYGFFLITAIILMFFQQKKARQLLSGKLFPHSKQLLLYPFLIVSGIILLSYTSYTTYEYDLGLYHLPNINWYQTFSIVPGLGNFHPRFAFNSNWFLLESLFGNRQIFGQPIFPINIIIIFLFILYSLQLLNKKGTKSVSGKATLFVLFLFAFQVFGYANSSSNDKPCDILIWIIVSIFLQKIEENSIKIWDKNSWIIIFLSVFVFSVKLSSAIILIIPGTLFLFSYKRYAKKSISSVILSGSYFSLWILRDIILSGMVIFPLPILQISALDWSIPKTLVDQMTKVIYYYAVDTYTPHDVVASMTFFEQLILWQKTKTIFFMIILFSGIVGNICFLVFDLYSIITKKLDNNLQNHIGYLLLDFYFVTGLFYWFISAPDPRFALGVILTASALVFARAINLSKTSQLFVDTILLATTIFSFWLMSTTFSWQSFSAYIFSPPPIPEVEIEEYTLTDGNSIYKPIDGDQCWDAPLPCTGWIYDGLVMRGSEISDGYKIIDPGE